MEKHKHAEVIKAWADGEKIEYRDFPNDNWLEARTPIWAESKEYRIKPAEPERKQLETTLTEEELKRIVSPYERFYQPTAAANAALRHACDTGQIVPRAEFDRAIADHELKEEIVGIVLWGDIMKYWGKHGKFPDSDQVVDFVRDWQKRANYAK